MNLTKSFPFYVTRRTADGKTMSYSCSFWMFALFMIIIWASVIGWGTYGLVQLVLQVIEAF